MCASSHRKKARWGHGGSRVRWWTECYCVPSLSCLWNSREKGGIKRGAMWEKWTDRGNKKKRGDKIRQEGWEELCEMGGVDETRDGWVGGRRWENGQKGEGEEGNVRKERRKRLLVYLRTLCRCFHSTVDKDTKEKANVGNCCLSRQ